MTVHTYNAVDKAVGSQVSREQRQKVLAAAQNKKQSDTGQLAQEVHLSVGLPVEFSFNMEIRWLDQRSTWHHKGKQQ